jgi:predicted MFS family arabinose efflux permease
VSRAAALRAGLAPLRYRGFRRLAGGQLASNLGDACYAVALPWYVLATHGGTLLLGTVLVAYGVPRTAALVVGGSASDRWRPWTVMMISDVARAAALAGMAAAAALGPARAVVLVPVAALLGAGEGLFLPGSFAIVPELLPGPDLQAGNALTSAGTQLATLVGPAAGGVLVAFLGSWPAFAIDAGSFVISALTLAGVRRAVAVPVSVPALAVEPEPEPGPAPTVRRLLRTEPVLRVILLIIVAANLGVGGLIEVAMPTLAHGPLHTAADGYGALVAAFGGGALIGTLAAGLARQARRPALVGSAAFLGEALVLAVVPYLGSVAGDGAALAVFGALNGFGNIVMLTVFQRWSPPALLGRLSGLILLASFGLYPVSVALGALVVHRVGPAPFFPVAAGLLAVAILAGLGSRNWRDLGRTDRPGLATAEAPAGLAGTP